MSTIMLPRRRLLAIAAAPLGALPGMHSLESLAAPGEPDDDLEQLAVTANTYCPGQAEWNFFGLINRYRRQNGLPALALSRTLGAAAKYHSQSMAKYNYFSHDLLNGRSWYDNIVHFGYTASPALAENIAAGYNQASNTFEQWRNSSGHNANMLSPKYSAIGIGRALNRNSSYYAYWTTTFGGVFDGGPYC